jgi:hypothetical protein
MDSPEPPAPVVVRMSDGDDFRGTLAEEQSDGWLLKEESGRLIHLYSQEVNEIHRYEDAEAKGLPSSGTVDINIDRRGNTIRYHLNRILR